MSRRGGDLGMRLGLLGLRAGGPEPTRRRQGIAAATDMPPSYAPNGGVSRWLPCGGHRVRTGRVGAAGTPPRLRTGACRAAADALYWRFCDLLDDIARESRTRFPGIAHLRLTMARMDRLYGVAMAERGVSRPVSVDLAAAAADLAAE